MDRAFLLLLCVDCFRPWLAGKEAVLFKNAGFMIRDTPCFSYFLTTQLLPSTKSRGLPRTIAYCSLPQILSQISRHVLLQSTQNQNSLGGTRVCLWTELIVVGKDIGVYKLRHRLFVGRGQFSKESITVFQFYTESYNPLTVVTDLFLYFVCVFEIAQLSVRINAPEGFF